jgi:hypothetical protein
VSVARHSVHCLVLHFLLLTIRASTHKFAAMKITPILKEAAGKSLRGMKIEDAYRFVKYSVADGAITAIDALNIRMALDAAGWLIETGRLDGARHIALRDMRGSKLASALENVLTSSEEATVHGYAQQWRAQL